METIFIALFARLVEFFLSIQNYDENTPPFGAIWWGILFRGPAYLLYGGCLCWLFSLSVNGKSCPVNGRTLLSGHWLALLEVFLFLRGNSCRIYLRLPLLAVCGTLRRRLASRIAPSWATDMPGTRVCPQINRFSSTPQRRRTLFFRSAASYYPLNPSGH